MRLVVVCSTAIHYWRLSQVMSDWSFKNQPTHFWNIENQWIKHRSLLNLLQGPMLYPSFSICFRCVSCDDDLELTLCVKYIWKVSELCQVIFEWPPNLNIAIEWNLAYPFCWILIIWFVGCIAEHSVLRPTEFLCENDSKLNWKHWKKSW